MVQRYHPLHLVTHDMTIEIPEYDNVAKVLYDMYVATDCLFDTVYKDPTPDIERIIVADKTVTVYYKDGETVTYTGK